MTQHETTIAGADYRVILVTVADRNDVWVRAKRVLKDGSIVWEFLSALSAPACAVKARFAKEIAAFLSK